MTRFPWFPPCFFPNCCDTSLCSIVFNPYRFCILNTGNFSWCYVGYLTDAVIMLQVFLACFVVLKSPRAHPCPSTVAAADAAFSHHLLHRSPALSSRRVQRYIRLPNATTHQPAPVSSRHRRQKRSVRRSPPVFNMFTSLSSHAPLHLFSTTTEHPAFAALFSTACTAEIRSL